MFTRSRTVRALAVAAAAAALSACGSSKGGPTVQSSSSLHALLPAAIRSAGVVKVASDATYAPIESVVGGQIVGLDPDLGAALGAVLGVRFQFINQTFNGIIPALKAGRYDLAMSAMTDNKTRQAVVTFVDYLFAGENIMVKAGNPLGIHTLADLCGKTVAAETGTIEVSDAQTQNKKCANKLHLQQFPTQTGANLALSSGRVQVVLADSPVNDYAAAHSGGAFVIASGSFYAGAPYGIAIPKADTQLVNAVQAALKKIIADGTYAQVLAKWGLANQSYTKATINAGTGT